MHAYTQTAENLWIPPGSHQATLEFALSCVILEVKDERQNSITHHIFYLRVCTYACIYEVYMR